MPKRKQPQKPRQNNAPPVKKISRRTFIRGALGLGTAVAVGGIGAALLRGPHPKGSVHYWFGNHATKEDGLHLQQSFQNAEQALRKKGQRFQIFFGESVGSRENNAQTVRVLRQFRTYVRDMRKKGISEDKINTYIKQQIRKHTAFSFDPFTIPILELVVHNDLEYIPLENHSEKKVNHILKITKEIEAIQNKAYTLPFREGRDLMLQINSLIKEIINFRDPLMAKKIRSTLASLAEKQDQPIHAFAYSGAAHFNILNILQEEQSHWKEMEWNAVHQKLHPSNEQSVILESLRKQGNVSKINAARFLIKRFINKPSLAPGESLKNITITVQKKDIEDAHIKINAMNEAQFQELDRIYKKHPKSGIMRYQEMLKAIKKWPMH